MVVASPCALAVAPLAYFAAVTACAAKVSVERGRERGREREREGEGEMCEEGRGDDKMVVGRDWNSIAMLFLLH